MNGDPEITPPEPDYPVPQTEPPAPLPPDYPVPKPGDLPDYPVPEPEEPPPGPDEPWLQIFPSAIRHKKAASDFRNRQFSQGVKVKLEA
jgi:hypothetical protein